MARNNLFALSFHIFIIVFLLSLSNFFTNNVFTIIISVVFSISYVLFGLFVLSDMGSRIRNIISVCLPALLGIVILAFCIFSTDYSLTEVNKNYNRMIWLMMYSIFELPFVYAFEFLNAIIVRITGNSKLIIDIVSVYLALMPTILMWLGTIFKKNNSNMKIVPYKNDAT